MEAEFGSFTGLAINGSTVTGTGFLFRVRNTSYGDGGSSSFALRPDGDFAHRGQLTPAAEAALSAGQPYGLYAFEVHLPAGAGALISAPEGFELHREYRGGGHGGSGERSDRDAGDDESEWVELSFRIDLEDAARGLLFDDRAPAPGTPFSDPRFGFLEFFVSTSSHDLEDNLQQEGHGQWGLGVRTSLAWARDGEVVTRFCDFHNERLQPHGDLVVDTSQPVPEPGSAALIALGFLLLAARQRRRALASGTAAT